MAGGWRRVIRSRLVRLRVFQSAPSTANRYGLLTEEVSMLGSGASVLNLDALQGRQSGDPGARLTPCALRIRARVSTAAPYRMFRATVATRRFSGNSRNDPRTQSLKAAMAGPHQIW